MDLLGDFEILECVTYKLPRREGRWFLFALRTTDFNTFDEHVRQEADLIFRRLSSTADRIKCKNLDSYLKQDLNKFLFEPTGSTLSVFLDRESGRVYIHGNAKSGSIVIDYYQYRK